LGGRTRYASSNSSLAGTPAATLVRQVLGAISELGQQR
jgi:hypothetical protein